MILKDVYVMLFCSKRLTFRLQLGLIFCQYSEVIKMKLTVLQVRGVAGRPLTELMFSSLKHLGQQDTSWSFHLPKQGCTCFLRGETLWDHKEAGIHLPTERTAQQ